MRSLCGNVCDKLLLIYRLLTIEEVNKEINGISYKKRKSVIRSYNELIKELGLIFKCMLWSSETSVIRMY